jgi:hypothetical protein
LWKTLTTLAEVRYAQHFEEAAKDAYLDALAVIDGYG